MAEDSYVWIMNLWMVKRRVGVELHCFNEQLPLVSMPMVCYNTIRFG
jgi:hypothetical protein